MSSVTNLHYATTHYIQIHQKYDSALQRWKFEHTTEQDADPRPTLDQYDGIRNEWRSKDRVTKFIGLFSSKRFHTDWRVAQPEAARRENTSWTDFKLQETFTAFCNRVEKEAVHCYFKCAHDNCTADTIAIRDQIVIGTNCHNIREESLLKSWDLQQLRTEGMRMESALRGGTEIRGNNVNRLGKYSFKNMKQQLSSTGKSNIPKQRKPVSCFYCGEKTNNISTHRESCKGKDNKCSVCSKYGHLPAVCRQRKDIRNIYKDEHDEEPTKEEYKSYNVNLFVMTTSKSSPQPRLRSILKNDFHAQVIINNVLDRVLADTGAKVSVCGTVQAKKWGLQNKMTEVNVKIKPYRRT